MLQVTVYNLETVMHFIGEANLILFGGPITNDAHAMCSVLHSLFSQHLLDGYEVQQNECAYIRRGRVWNDFPLFWKLHL